MGERSLIQEFRRHPPGHPWLIVGPGQDCAVLRWGQGRDLAYKIDQVVEGTHFTLSGPEASTPRRIGWKAMAKACSDIAATGFWPVAATVGANLNRSLGDDWALELHRGLVACCERFAFALAGGDISSSDGPVSVCVSLLGEGPAGGAWLRSGAKPGDWLLVTGDLGGSRGGKHLDFTPRLEEARRIRDLAGRGVHACIDITDGLARDAGHLCDESACGLEIDLAALPVAEAARAAAQKDLRPELDHVLGDGEDFELLLAVEPTAAQALLKQWNLPTRLTRIGRIVPKDAGRTLVEAGGRKAPMPDLGYEHATEKDA
ncbi:MAG: thiamine-phosphate kinase [Planctomycetota bacterium]|nr:thiamine-phosphate kinase [Planctomycetota bacterium]